MNSLKILFILAFSYLVFSLSDTCDDGLSLGGYDCLVNHPNHVAHGASLKIFRNFQFHYTSNRVDEPCNVKGIYSIQGKTITLRPRSDADPMQLACIVGYFGNVTILFPNNTDPYYGAYSGNDNNSTDGYYNGNDNNSTDGYYNGNDNNSTDGYDNGNDNNSTDGYYNGNDNNSTDGYYNGNDNNSTDGYYNGNDNNSTDGYYNGNDNNSTVGDQNGNGNGDQNTGNGEYYGNGNGNQYYYTNTGPGVYNGNGNQYYVNNGGNGEQNNGDGGQYNNDGQYYGNGDQNNGNGEQYNGNQYVEPYNNVNQYYYNAATNSGAAKSAIKEEVQISFSIIQFSDCDFQDGCDLFTCFSANNPYGETELSCNFIADMNYTNSFTSDSNNSNNNNNNDDDDNNNNDGNNNNDNFDNDMNGSAVLTVSVLLFAVALFI